VGDVTIGVGLGIFGPHSSIPGPQYEEGIFVSFLENARRKSAFSQPLIDLAFVLWKLWPKNNKSYN